MAAIKEANHGFAFKIVPYVVCSYDVDCEDIADLRTETDRTAHHVSLTDMACAWFADAAAGKEPPSWQMARKLMADGYAGVLVPSFAPGATEEDHNLVLWGWGKDLPHKIEVFDPSGRLPKNQLSWD